MTTDYPGPIIYRYIISNALNTSRVNRIKIYSLAAPENIARHLAFEFVRSCTLAFLPSFMVIIGFHNTQPNRPLLPNRSGHRPKSSSQFIDIFLFAASKVAGKNGSFSCLLSRRSMSRRIRLDCICLLSSIILRLSGSKSARKWKFSFAKHSFYPWNMC